MSDPVCSHSFSCHLYTNNIQIAYLSSLGPIFQLPIGTLQVHCRDFKSIHPELNSSFSLKSYSFLLRMQVYSPTSPSVARAKTFKSIFNVPPPPHTHTLLQCLILGRPYQFSLHVILGICLPFTILTAWHLHCLLSGFLSLLPHWHSLQQCISNLFFTLLSKYN